jgi:hypothetical protein
VPKPWLEDAVDMAREVVPSKDHVSVPRAGEGWGTVRAFSKACILRSLVDETLSIESNVSRSEVGLDSFPESGMMEDLRSAT